MGTATIEYTKHGARATTWIKGLASLSKSVELALSLTAYTNAGISRVGFTVADDSQIAPEVSGEEFDALSYYAVVFFRDEDNAVVKFVLPAPKRSQFEVSGKRLQLKKSHGEELAAIVGAKIGKTLTFAHGGISTSQ